MSLELRRRFTWTPSRRKDQHNEVWNCDIAGNRTEVNVTTWKDQRNGFGIATETIETVFVSSCLRWKDQRNEFGIATLHQTPFHTDRSFGGKTSAMSLELRRRRIADGRLPAYRWKDQRNGFGIATSHTLYML